MRKQILNILALLFGLMGILPSAYAISVGVYELPPHMITTEGPLKGAVPEFFNRYIFTDSSLKVQWSSAHFSRILVELESGRLDMAILVAKTPEREQKFIYSEIPLYRTRSGIIVKKDSRLQRLETLGSMNGMVLGHDLGSVVPSYFKKISVQFNYVSGENYFNRNLSLVRSGRIDGYFVPTWSHGLYELKKGQYLSDFSILEIPAEPLNLYVVFSKKLSAQIIQNVNNSLRVHRAQYLKILTEY